MLKIKTKLVLMIGGAYSFVFVLAAKAAVIDVIPPCTKEATVKGDCRDVSIFITLLINFGRYIFGVIGALALLMFVYGGFLLILSQGQQDKIKKGSDAMLAAVTGLVIAFGAYMIVRFLGTSVGVNSEYLLK